MKTWSAYGSEHSANLVMIGRFETEDDAQKAKRIIDALSDQVRADMDSDRPKLGRRPERFTDDMLDLLGQLRVHSVGPGELEQFVYDVHVKLNGTLVEVRTDEMDISAFLKVLFEQGARIEIYSARGTPEPDNTEPGKQ